MNFTERSTQITYLAQLPRLIHGKPDKACIKNEAARSWWKAKVIFKHYLPHDRRYWRQTSKVTHGLHFTIMLFLIVTLIVEKDVKFRKQGGFMVLMKQIIKSHNLTLWDWWQQWMVHFLVLPMEPWKHTETKEKLERGGSIGACCSKVSAGSRPWDKGRGVGGGGVERAGIQTLR